MTWLGLHVVFYPNPRRVSWLKHSGLGGDPQRLMDTDTVTAAAGSNSQDGAGGREMSTCLDDIFIR